MSELLPDAAPATPVLLRHDAVDVRLRVVGQEFELDGVGARGAWRVWADLLCQPALHSVLLRHFVFIRLDAADLGADAVAGLPVGRVALGVRPQADTDVAPLAAALRTLKARGHPVFVDGFSPGWGPLLDAADYLRVDLGRGLADCQPALAAARAAGVAAIGLGCANSSLRDAAHAAGCQLFQGAALARVESGINPAAEAGRSHVFELLNLAKVQADLSDLEDVLRRDPMLTYQLLRYVNSPGCGLTTPVRDLKHALMVMGYQPLYRWLTLLLYHSGEFDGRAHWLLRQALVRARLMESLGRAALGAAQADGLFLCGMLSLLDRLLGQPLEAALARVSLARPLLDALLGGKGPYAPYLVLARVCDGESTEGSQAAVRACAPDGAAVTAAHLEALAWADRVDT